MSDKKEDLKTQLAEIDEHEKYLKESIIEQEEILKIGVMYEEMVNTEAFKTIIETGYCKEEADRLAQGMTNPTINDGKIIDAMKLKLDGIREFNKYMMYLKSDISEAEETIKRNKLAIEENANLRKEITARNAREV
jgi:hypothetical protein